MKTILGFLGAALILVFGTVAFAQSTCDTNCPIRTRDARGCCPASSAPAPPPPPAQRPGSPRPTPPPPAASKGCPQGREVTVDTAGHCCWPGQAWAGTKCVGVPASCPEGHTLDTAAEACTLEACVGGRTRTTDNVHCCYPGQAWSTRGECLGKPTCPEGMEAEGDSCASADRDGDGIPNSVDKCPDAAEDKDGFEDADGCPDPDNDGDGVVDAADKCPTQPEDKNGYKDDDGCPDEQERLAVVGAQARADAARNAQQTREREAAAERERIEAADRAAAGEELSRKARQTTGWWLAGSGLVSLGASGVLAALSNGTNSTIQSGGLSSGTDIESKNQEGKTLGTASIVFAAVGGVLVVIGVPLIVFNLSGGTAQRANAKIRWSPGAGLQF